MRVRLLPVLVVLALGGLAGPAHAAPSDLVVSQVYGGGGNAGATLRNDYVELLNRGTSPVELGGLSVQYASAGGAFTQVTPLPAGTVAPGRRHLVAQAAGSGGTTDLPAPDTTGTIAMSATAGKVALAAGAAPLGCGSTAAPCDAAALARILDLVGYGGASLSEGGAPAPGLSNTTAARREGGGCTDSDRNAEDFRAGEPAPRNSAAAATPCDDAPPPPPPPPAAAPERTIAAIQGAAHRSPLAGERVATAGVVTALRSNGFYLQDPQGDDDPRTSEAIFVFTGAAPTVSRGDAATVTGVVGEFRPGGSGGGENLSTTQIASPTVARTGTGAVAPTTIGAGGRVPPSQVIEDDAGGDVETGGAFDPAQDGIDFYESLEGMLVRVDDAVAVGPTSSFGETPVLADGGSGFGPRTPRGGIVVRPTDFNPERLFLDDTIAGDEPTLDVRDRFAGPVDAVVDYSFGNFKLLALAWPPVTDGGLEREVTDAPDADQLAVASFNVENLDPRDPVEKFDRLARTVVENLRSPDVLTVEEVQDDNGAVNDATVDATATWSALIAAIRRAGGPAYDFRDVDPVDDRDGGQPGGNIRVGFLFREDRGLEFVDRDPGGPTTATGVRRVRGDVELTASPGRIDPANPAWANSRKPLAGEFRWRGKTVIVIANHFASKGGDQPLFGRFQPPERSSEVQRHRQAAVLNAFVDQVQAAKNSARIVVAGDFNDFEFSRTLEILEGGKELVNLMETLPENDRYSYVFQGNSQALDHILVNRQLREGAEYDSVHVNAEFADQVSDHDPQVARLRLED